MRGGARELRGCGRDRLDARPHWTPAPTADPSASPGATEPPFLNVSGSIAGEPFVLDSNAVVTLDANGRGSYSGPDLNGGGLVSGTFSCG